MDKDVLAAILFVLTFALALLYVRVLGKPGVAEADTPLVLQCHGTARSAYVDTSLREHPDLQITLECRGG